METSVIGRGCAFCVSVVLNLEPKGCLDNRDDEAGAIGHPFEVENQSTLWSPPRACCSVVRARDSRDFTVPVSMSRASAISS
jgi:hypothetical protein